MATAVLAPFQDGLDPLVSALSVPSKQREMLWKPNCQGNICRPKNEASVVTPGQDNPLKSEAEDTPFQHLQNTKCSDDASPGVNKTHDCRQPTSNNSCSCKPSFADAAVLYFESIQLCDDTMW